ncbi:cellulase family glycosylhydrolase [Ruminococcus sp.]|uniref:cellulase family glycosylhydrolase n=1 Tax=Ruminococcus sp. TaxID=41978 RepID=UPI0025E2AA08|nr:cellulase family glycosylhydrolase [Ruminococcus sp.]MBQ9542838.1 cellulase family glycosylhydrolase [Ruminococcus sp.]
MKIKERLTERVAACLLCFGATAVVCADAASTGDTTVTKVTAKDVSKYTAAQLNADMGLGLAANEGFDTAQARSAKDRGLNTVKVSADWSEHVSADGEYTIDADWLAGLKKTVDAAVSQDMYIILEAESKSDDGRSAVWEQLAENFAKYDRKLIFAGDLTEPVTAENDTSGKNNTSDKTEKKSVIQTIRSVKGNEHRVLLLNSADWYDVAADADMMVSVSGESLDVTGTAFTEEDTDMIKTQLGRYELDWLDAGIPVVINGASESSFAKAAENVKWAESFGTLAKQLGVPAVFENIGGKDDKAAVKLLDTYKNGTVTGTVLESFDAEKGTKVVNSGYVDLKLKSGGKITYDLTMEELFGDADAEKVTAVRFTGSCGFRLGSEKGKDSLKRVLTADELKGDSIKITSESSWGRVYYEVLAADKVLEPYTKYLQFTEPDENGKCYARAVMMVKEEDVEDAVSVKFTFDLSGQSASVSSGKFYRAVSQQGEIIDPDDGYVFVAAVISGIPEEAAEDLTITDIELV